MITFDQVGTLLIVLGIFMLIYVKAKHKRIDNIQVKSKPFFIALVGSIMLFSGFCIPFLKFLV